MCLFSPCLHPNNSYFKLRYNAEESMASFLGISYSHFFHTLHQLKEHCPDKNLAQHRFLNFNFLTLINKELHRLFCPKHIFRVRFYGFSLYLGCGEERNIFLFLTPQWSCPASALLQDSQVCPGVCVLFMCRGLCPGFEVFVKLCLSC